MKVFRHILFITIIFLLTGCSPFENSSLIEIITEPISSILTNKTSVEIVSGGTQTIETNPSTPAINYKVTVSVGGTYNQTATTTNGGYKIYTTIQGSDVQ
jgi:PBP1b-binding outer membrane lipoprotein LpoB